MDVLIKSSNGITQVSANAKLLSKRKVFVAIVTSLLGGIVNDKRK